MDIEEVDFDEARRIAEAILESTADVNRDTRLVALAIYVAAQAAARADTDDEALELAEDFSVMVSVQLEDMLEQKRRAKLS